MNKILLIVLAVALFGLFSHFQLNTSSVEKPVRQLLRMSNIDNTAFQKWCQKYNKNFANSDMEAYREVVFNNNLEKIQAHNSQNAGWTMGENAFMDMTSEEFVETHTGLNYRQKNKQGKQDYKITVNGGSIDWRNKGVLTPVKNQASCGACYAFSTTGQIESFQAIKTGKLNSYSEQQLVSCSQKYGNNGCHGGLMENAYEYILDYGIETEDDYPYVGKVTQCAYDSSKAIKGIFTSYVDIPEGQCDEVVDALQTQPISVGVDAHIWQLYSKGILKNCGTNLNHAVLVVGYQEGEYWTLKNSWGPSWGENGFIRLAPGSTCGMCINPSYVK